MKPPPRLRVFAGPNGSGKSTLQNVLPPKLLGYYVNPDEIEKSIKENDYLSFDKWGINADEKELNEFFENSTLAQKAELLHEFITLRIFDNKLSFHDILVNSYYASILADFIRQKLVKHSESFSFETVMSSTDKLDLLDWTASRGYRNYLYFVATEDPVVNISRVKNRVEMGGHTVPEEKIISRYYRSLENLHLAIKKTKRAFIFDNSTHNQSKLWLAEISNGKELTIQNDLLPSWFSKYVLEKLQ